MDGGKDKDDSGEDPSTAAPRLHLYHLCTGSGCLSLGIPAVHKVRGGDMELQWMQRQRWGRTIDQEECDLSQCDKEGECECDPIQCDE